MRYIFLLSSLLLAACGIRPSNIDFGKTTTKDLISEMGEPLEIKPIEQTSSEIYQYQDNQKFQIKNDIVTHGFADPKGEEKTLIFWKHKLKDCSTTEKMIAPPVGHELPEYELKCSEEGITVIYTKGSEFVSRVIRHEKK